MSSCRHVMVRFGHGVMSSCRHVMVCFGHGVMSSCHGAFGHGVISGMLFSAEWCTWRRLGTTHQSRRQGSKSRTFSSKTRLIGCPERCISTNLLLRNATEERISQITVALVKYITVTHCENINILVRYLWWAGIARYGLDGPRIESRWGGGRDFPHPSRPALGPTQPPIQ